jgi:hypothetical protein
MAANLTDTYDNDLHNPSKINPVKIAFFFIFAVLKLCFVMATWIVVLLFSVGAVLLFVVGMSLTLMIKGHHIDGEISTNRHMRERGITCVVHDAMDPAQRDDCADSSCANCADRCINDMKS